MPNERYIAQIGGEMRKVEGLWHQVNGKLPGLLISTEPLSNFNPSSVEFTLISFTQLSPDAAADTVDKVRKLLDKQLQWMKLNPQNEAPSPTLWQRIVESVELKPGVAGVRFDLKKFAARK